MDKLVIKKGPALNGTVRISGAKNAALPLLMTSLLTDSPCRYTNVPRLRDINTTTALLRELGVEVALPAPNDIVIDASTLESVTASYDLVRTMRASILVLGPLLAKQGKANVSLPGGCAIGARPVNLHLTGLEKMGAKIEVDEGYIRAEVDGRLKGARIFMDMARPWFVIINPNRSANTPLPNITVCTTHSNRIAYECAIKRSFCNEDWRAFSDGIQSVDLWCVIIKNGCDIFNRIRKYGSPLYPN